MGLALSLALILAAGTPRAERRWVVEPGQALITLDADPYSAFSSQLSGHLEELADGSLHLELRVPVRSFTSGNAGQDRNLPREGEIVFLLTAPKPGKNAALELEGTLVFGNVSRPGRFRFTMTRTDAMSFAHSVVDVHLRSFGFQLPAGMDDAARIELDTGLRQDPAKTSRG
jgi:hypothetical protein